MAVGLDNGAVRREATSVAAAALVKAGIDLILTSNEAATQAAKTATQKAANRLRPRRGLRGDGRKLAQILPQGALPGATAFGEVAHQLLRGPLARRS